MSNAVDQAVEDYCRLLRRRQIEGSLPCAKKTADVLRIVITKRFHADCESLVEDVRQVGAKLQAAKPVEIAVGNIVRRVLHIIREEKKREELPAELQEPVLSTTSPAAPGDSRPQAQGLLSQALRPARGPHLGIPSLFTLLEGVADTRGLDQQPPQPPEQPPQPPQPAAPRAAAAAESEAESMASTSFRRPGLRSKATSQWKGKAEVIDTLNELIDELEHIKTSITAQGVEHIHANEVILTLGLSDTTFLFLKEAAKKREFQVVAAEGAPKFDGHSMAKKLSDAGIQTTLIADSAVFAMMARANKVLVGAHAVLANGGVIASVGMHMVALAAKRHSIPFVVLVGLHKLSPLFPQDTDLTYNDFKSPAQVVDYGVVSEAFERQEAVTRMELPRSPAASPPGTSPLLAAAVAASRWDALGGNVHVPNPAFDYVPPHLISLFITDNGGHTPSYVYRLITEHYSREDYLLSKDAANDFV